MEPATTTFTIDNLITAIGKFVTYIFTGASSPVKVVLDLVVQNEILWVFIAFGICTIGISVLKRLRSIFQ